MTSFATPQELSTYLTGRTLDEEADAEWIAQATLLLELISADVQTAARNRIIAGETTAKLAGTWNSDLELPVRPIVSVDAVSVNGSPLAAGSYLWNDRAVVRSGGWMIAANGPDLAEGGAHWGGPVSTVVIDYAYGYTAETVPDFVKSLVLRIAARTIGNPGDGVAQESLGPYSVSYRNTLAAGGSHVSDLEARMLRRRFSRTAGTITAGSL